MNNIRSSVYAQKVELLLRLIPIVMEEHVFAIHGGTAINLFTTMTPLCKNCLKWLNELIVKAVFSKIPLKFSD